MKKYRKYKIKIFHLKAFKKRHRLNILIKSEEIIFHMKKYRKYRIKIFHVKAVKKRHSQNISDI